MRFDEVYGPDGIRPHYRQLMDRLESIGGDDLADRFPCVASTTAMPITILGSGFRSRGNGWPR